jgi:hypothetical protein
MNTSPETAKVLKGLDNTTKAVLQFMSKEYNRISICLDSSGPATMVKHDPYKRALLELKYKGVKSMYITQITSHNISHCKELIKLTCELRHLDGVKGNFAVSESEYIAATYLQKAKAEPKLIYSNLREMVEAQQYVFDSLWARALAAEQKIKQIEEGESEFHKVIIDRNEAANILLDLAKSIKKEALFLLPNDKALLRMDRLGVLDTLVVASKGGVSVKIICPITEQNSNLVKRTSEKAPELKIHSCQGLPYGIFIADNSKYFSAELKQSDARQFQEAIGFSLYSNSKPGIDSFKSFFELLWNKSLTDAPLTQDEVRSYVNIVLNEIHDYKADQIK